jgi:hypothetical protein
MSKSFHRVTDKKPATRCSKNFDFGHVTRNSAKLRDFAGFKTTLRRILSRCLPKNFEKCLRHLCARERRQAINDEEGNSLKAQLESLLCLLIHFFSACFAVQKCPRIDSGKAHFRGDFSQNVVSTNVTTFGEISPEECF